MKKKKADEIMEDFYKEYQEDPAGWSFWISPPPSSDDFYEAYIVHGNEAFFLKIDSIYSANPIGVGTKLSIEKDQIIQDLPEFGYRKFSREELEHFFKSLPKPTDYETEQKFVKDLQKSQKKFVEKTLEKNPSKFGPLEEKGEIAAIGPYSSRNPLEYISKKQEELKKELSKKLDKIIRKDYPGYY